MHHFPVQTLLHVPGIVCDRCVAAVVGALRAADDGAHVVADPAARTVRVVSKRFESRILRTLREAGFPAEPVLQPLG